MLINKPNLLIAKTPNHLKKQIELRRDFLHVKHVYQLV